MTRAVQVDTYGNFCELFSFVEQLFEQSPDMKKLFMAIHCMLERANLALVYTGAKETVEIHLRGRDYPYAFGSIQYCRPKSGEYLELRFKRDHLKYAGAFEALDQLRDNPYRHDVNSPDPEAVRFRFHQFDAEAFAFINRLGEILRPYTG